MSFIASPELATDRLMLRQWRESDLAGVAAVINGEGREFIGGPMDDDSAIWRQLATMAGHWSLVGFGLYALEDKETGSFVGWTGLLLGNDRKEPELAWSLHPDWRGKGYAVEAARRVMRHAYTDLSMPPLMSFIDPKNEASQDVAKRLGAEMTGEQMFRGTLMQVWRHAGSPA